MDEPRGFHTERSKSEGVKQISYIKGYIYMDSRKMQDRNRGPGIEDGFVDIQGEGVEDEMRE